MKAVAAALREAGIAFRALLHLQATICGWIGEQPDLTLLQLSERLHAEQGIEIKKTALHRQLDKWGLTFKKNAARQRTATRGRAAGAV